MNTPSSEPTEILGRQLAFDRVTRHRDGMYLRLDARTRIAETIAFMTKAEADKVLNSLVEDAMKNPNALLMRNE